ncbi:MAG: hypothetical protein M3501_06480 [Actinomycetota bacterium]|nr:hypothetical protein [Actinomycetota bacterium]
MNVMLSRRTRSRRSVRRTMLSVLAVPAVALAASACSEDTQDSVESAAEDVGEDVGDAADDVQRDGAEVIARNLATELGETAFEENDQPLDGKLKCKANASAGIDKIKINCKGTTQDGGAATMKGTTSEFPGRSGTTLEGTFTGTVDDKELFSVDQLSR